jgi:thymidylate synthase ThyX
MKRKIYSISGLPEETVAVCFAKCSRSSESFLDIAEELSEEKSSKFHRKWVVGYGHSSVAEHAVVRLAMENVSLLAVEWIQDNRLASYTEKSSRYQIYDINRYVVPEELNKDKEAKKLFKETIDSLLTVYQKIQEPMKKYIEKTNPKERGEEEGRYQARIRGKYIDQIRFLLPSAMMANLGMTANARTWEYAISKWLSSGVLEVQKIGQEAKKEVRKICPTLVKYAQVNPYLEEVGDFKVKGKGKVGSKKVVEVVDADKGAVDKILASLIYKSLLESYKEIYKKVKKMNKKEKKKVLGKILKKRTEHDRLPRDFEQVYISFEVLCDQGAYYDLKRNRMMTQIRQRLGVENGYMMPKAVKEIGFTEEYEAVMEQVSEAYKKLVKRYPVAAQYLVTKAHNRRFLMKMNLRELFYFVRLRARKAGNFSYRRVALAILEETKKIYPEIMEFFFEERDLGKRVKIEKKYFARTV